MDPEAKVCDICTQINDKVKGKRKFKKVYLKVLDEQVTNECTVQVQNILFNERKTCHRLNFWFGLPFGSPNPTSDFVTN